MNNFNLSDLLTTIPAFIVAIVILVGFHELGHFWVARRLGIRVLKFSIGFGKPLWKHVSAKDGVEYVIGAIPLGGYVKLLGERSDDDQPIAAHDLPYSFQRAPVWKRILVLLAGPAANLLLAILFYWILMLAGTPALKPLIGEVTENSVAALAGMHSGDLITEVQGHEVITREDATMQLFTELIEGPVQLVVQGDQGSQQPRILNITAASHLDLNNPENLFGSIGFEFWHPVVAPVIGTVVHDAAADRAGLKTGDLILAIDGQAVSDFGSLIKLVAPLSGRTVAIQVRRDGATLEMPITVAESTENGKKVGKIGVGTTSVKIPDSMWVSQKYGLVSGLGHAFGKTWDAISLDVRAIRLLLSRKIPANNLSGSLGIAEITGEAARHGLLTFIGWLAFLSVNLGILNLLPIPVLDGGQVVYQLIELVKGSPVSERVQLMAQQIGIAALIMLVSLTLYNDIARHLS